MDGKIENRTPKQLMDEIAHDRSMPLCDRLLLLVALRNMNVDFYGPAGYYYDKPPARSLAIRDDDAFYDYTLLDFMEQVLIDLARHARTRIILDYYGRHRGSGVTEISSEHERLSIRAGSDETYGHLPELVEEFAKRAGIEYYAEGEYSGGYPQFRWACGIPSRSDFWETISYETLLAAVKADVPLEDILS